MPLIRFSAAREVFDAFPTAYDTIKTEPTEEPPVSFLRSLAKGPTPEEAVNFCAYLLPRREAVWWASQCVRALIPDLSEAEEAPLKAAEEWVAEPEEEKRRDALRMGMEGDRMLPSTWVALAAAWSGGNMVINEQGGTPAPAHLTARAASAALLLAMAQLDPTRRAEYCQSCVERGIRIAED